eukprot:3685812-Prymnesium_polylepis.1
MAARTHAQHASCQHQPAVARAHGTHRRCRPWQSIAAFPVILLPKNPPLPACSVGSLAQCAPISCGYREQA